MASSSSVDHYDRMQKLQEIQYERERQRHLLEQQLNSYLQSGDRLSKLKAAKLQSYWKKVCDDERKARVRNENLLRDFSRLESYVTAMSNKTERLKTVKNQYEEQVERMYPKWREQLEQKYLLSQVQQGSTGTPGTFPAQRLYPDSTGPFSIPVTQPGPSGYAGQEPGGSPLTPPRPVAQSGINVPAQGKYGQPLQPDKLQPITEASADNSLADASQRTDEGLPALSSVQPARYARETDPSGRGGFPQDQKPARESSYVDSRGPAPAKRSPRTSPRGASSHQDRPTPTPTKRSPRFSDSGSSPPDQPRRHLVMSESEEEEDDTKPSEKELREAELVAAAQRQTPSPRKDKEYGVQEESILSFLSDDLSDFDISSQLHGTDHKEGIQVHIEEKKKPVASPRRVRADSGSDASDISLDEDRPRQQEQSSPQQPSTKQPSPRVESRVPLTRDHSKSSVASETTGPSVTTTGFWTMVKAIDDDLPVSLGPERMYRSRECSPSIRAEIIRSANEGQSLGHLDPVAVSMIVLHELPLLVRDMPTGCLIPDKMLNKVITITADNAGSYMFSSSVGFWEKLVQHFANLVKYHVMQAREVAQKFAPLLISEDSSLQSKAVAVLQATLDSREEQSESSSTLASSPMGSPGEKPVKVESSSTGGKMSQQPAKVPDIDIDDEPDEDSFFDNVKLTETPAYQKMIGSAQLSKGADDSDDDEVSALEKTEDDEDDIEKAARLTPTTPTSSQTKKRGNLLSSLGLSYGSDDEDEKNIESKLSTSWRSANVASPDENSLISTPSATPRSPAYVPTAVESGNQSRSESAAKRSAAFWDGSDLDDSDSILVPMAGSGTQKKVDPDEDKDDFDFYD